jgi:hypothetical protein
LYLGYLGYPEVLQVLFLQFHLFDQLNLVVLQVQQPLNQLLLLQLNLEVLDYPEVLE